MVFGVERTKSRTGACSFSTLCHAPTEEPFSFSATQPKKSKPTSNHHHWRNACVITPVVNAIAWQLPESAAGADADGVAGLFWRVAKAHALHISPPPQKLTGEDIIKHPVQVGDS
jgi:hypothetical protein